MWSSRRGELVEWVIKKRVGPGEKGLGLGLGELYWATNQGCSVEEEEEGDDGGGRYRGIFCNWKGKGKKRTEKKRRK